MLVKKFSRYDERDYAFGQVMVTLRTTLGLTQAGLAEFLGVSRRAVLEWEGGSSYPTADHLTQFITLCVQQQAFPAGREAQEIRTLWKTARQKVLLDEQWLSALLGEQPPALTLVLPEPAEGTGADALPVARSYEGLRTDWGEALDVLTFYGREMELATLSQWVVQEHCRVVSMLGMGGIGKSALAVKVMHGMAEHFEVVLWRSVADAPSCEELLDECLQMLSPHSPSEMPASLERRISLLLEHLRERRALVVLDNLEALLEEGDVTGHFRPGFEAYGRLLRRVAETGHQSCLLLTSREKPADLVPLEGIQTPVRALRLSGLDAVACEQLLQEKGVVGTPQERTRLIEAYAGNPLALKIVAQTIADLFGGEIGQFLAGGEVVFGSIHDLLTEQFARLSALEQTVLLWLAIVREPVSIDELLPALVTSLSRVQVLEAINGLLRRSLIEHGKRQASFALQSVVLEYVTALLIAEVTSEIGQGRLDCLIEHALSQAGTKEYVRQTQERLLVAAILAQLRRAYQGRTEVEEQLHSLLDQLRQRADYAQGYGPANLLALLHQHRGHLCSLDLSNLSIRGAYLQGVDLQDTKLSGATIRDTVFTDAFDAVWTVAISRNGTFWAVGGRRGEVRVWREAGQSLHLIWQAHTDTVSALAFSPDEKTLVTGSWDGAIKLWDVESGSLLWTRWQTGTIGSLTFAPDGLTLASGNEDASVRLWNARDGAILQTLHGHTGPAYSVVWHPDGGLLVSGDFEGHIRLWTIQGKQPATCVQTLSGHTGPVLGLAFAPDGKWLASGGWDQAVRLWEVASGHCRASMEGHTSFVKVVAWSPDGHTVASGSWDHTIRFWDVESGKCRQVLLGHSAQVYTIDFTPDGCTLLSGSEDHSLRLWDVISGQCIRIMQGYAALLFDVAWSPDGTWLASACSDTTLTLWQTEDEIPLMDLRGHTHNVYGVAWSPDGQRVASCSWDQTIRVWDASTGKCVQVFQDPSNWFQAVAWSPDGRWLASGNYAHSLQVWDVAAGRHRWVALEQPGTVTPVNRVAWSPDGSRLASGSDDGAVRLWRAEDGRILQTLNGHHGRVMDVAWSPDGSRLASCGAGEGAGEVFVWDVQNSKRVRVLSGQSEIVYAVAWDPTGEVLVSGGSDGTLRWWEVASGTCLYARQRHQGWVRALKISPDGKRVASCGQDGLIMVWNMQRAEPLGALRRDRPYERLNITETKGLTQAQKASLHALGAVEEATSLCHRQCIPQQELLPT
jgi:WD40 repeat protein/DNA-binding XRE family transcriptional regulator